MDEQTTDVTTAEPQAPAPVESSTTETPKELEVVTEGEPVEVNQYETEDEEPAEAIDDAKESESDETKDTQEPREESEKRDANYRIRQLVQENKALKESIAASVKQAIPEYDVDQAIEDGVDPLVAEVEALKQRQNASERVAEITELNTMLNQEANDVAREFPYMDSTNPDRTPEQKALAETVTELWMKAANVQMASDENGTTYVTQATESLYDFVKKIDTIRSTAVADGAVQGQKNIEKQLAAVEIPTGRAPKVDRSDDASLSPEAYAKKYKLSVM